MLLYSLQAVETVASNTSASAAAAAAAGGGDVAYHVSESEFITCRLDSSPINTAAVPVSVTAYERLQSAESNYFIGELNARLSYNGSFT